LCIALALGGLALAAVVSLSALLIAAAYVALNIGYSAGSSAWRFSMYS